MRHQNPATKLNLNGLLIVSLLSCLFATGQAQATLLTSDAGYTGPGLDLTAYATGNYNFTFGPKPIPGGITFTSNVTGGGNSGQGSVLGQGSYGLAANGSFGGSAVYAGLDGANGYMTFSFATPVSSFGAYLNYAPGNGNPLIEAYDSANVLIESWNLLTSAPISTPSGFNAFAFRGISISSPTIASFRLNGSYLIAAASANGNPVAPPTNPNPTPEPASLALLGIGLAGLAASRRTQ